MRTLLESWNIPSIVFVGIDFYITWLIVYHVLCLIKANVRAKQLAKGALLLYGLNAIGTVFELPMLTLLTKEVMTWGILAIIIVFQPEIRNGLEQLGRNGALKRGTLTTIDWIDELMTAMQTLSQECKGALVVIERNISLEQFVLTGIPTQSVVTSQMLRTIFMTNTPLHDGAVIIRDNKIWCASAILPSSQNETIDSDLGTRHRAALGISEISDAITIVVSEETGICSLTYKGEIQRFGNVSQLEKRLRRYLRH